MSADGQLGIDFGTSSTVAVLRRGADPARPLLFDGTPLLPSAVYLETDGTVLTGRDAVHSARRDPARFEPSPKSRLGDGAVLLGDRELESIELVAAVLRRVATETVRVAGAMPGVVTLTHPANWAATRRGQLVEAARRAGLPAPKLVAEPVAAASYFSEVLGNTIPEGSAVVVYDFGAGTFDASVVIRGPQGYDTAVVDGLDVGGSDIDSAIVDWVGTRYGVKDPEKWQRLVTPREVEDRRYREYLWQDVRICKELLSRASTASLSVPSLDMDAHLTREELETLARPLIAQTVRTMVRVLKHAKIDTKKVAGVFLVGGSSRIPLVAAMLHRELSIASTIIEQPEMVVAEGSLRVPGGRTGHTRIMPVLGPASGPPAAGAASDFPVPSGAPILPQGGGPFEPDLPIPTGEPYPTGQPAGPGAAGQPYPTGQPSQYGQAAQPGQAGQPGQAAQYGQPAQSGQAAAFGQAAQPGRAAPSQFGQAAESGRAGQPGQPTPGRYGQADRSGQGARSGQVGTSGAAVVRPGERSEADRSPGRASGSAERYAVGTASPARNPETYRLPARQADGASDRAMSRSAPASEPAPRYQSSSAPVPAVRRESRPAAAPRREVEPVRSAPAPRRPAAAPPSRPSGGDGEHRMWPWVLALVLVIALVWGGWYGWHHRAGLKNALGIDSGTSSGDDGGADTGDGRPNFVPDGWTQAIGSVGAGWQDHKSAHGSCTEDTDGLAVDITRSDTTGMYRCNGRDTSFTDVAVETTVRVEQGCAGIWLRTDNKGYFLDHCDDGTVTFHLVTDADPSSKTQLGTWPASGISKLGAMVSGDSITVYGDDQQLGQVTNDKVHYGQVDLGAFTGDGDSARVVFADAQVWQSAD